ncbi:hypothetical protein SELMODRAFT_439107 [Selaginella moellendorffii]|uniref:glucan endo-1,3-beta-D-glucosidase n=1 Tax=Selaginella moellendorffii TaxID=88036 RepID=D8R2H5_SELML|nr:glucan endo-1,3-beta-D-glucosidase isoform X2 [Selaginella moellendorffii]EFJ34069.1 hypothetical protein SELMODRAFT_439107 [Selaginella moellendorffii]|eukprot:XP_002965231.1 glucan endo-1,3-beta-D-glucosidase isoform X2 [Selaginella moellendorffii]
MLAAAVSYVVSLCYYFCKGGIFFLLGGHCEVNAKNEKARRRRKKKKMVIGTIGKKNKVAMLFVALWLVFASSISSAEAAIGVNYGSLADNLSPPGEVVKLLKSSSIGKLKLYDADSAMLSALSDTGVEVVIGVTNEEIPRLGSPSFANAWVSKNVVQHLPKTKIKYISVGNEVLTTSEQQLASVLLPAMQNLHNALVGFKADDQVKVTSPQSLGILSVSFPPSSGIFKSKIVDTALKSVLQFLSLTKAPLMINAYPYFAYRNNPSDISLPYALFLPNGGFADPRTGLVYTNLLSAQLDAVYFAMEKLGFPNMELSVSETGWPSVGDVSEPGVSVQNAMNYNRNLISFVNSGVGTPARPRVPLEAYIFSLFNEDLKPGPTSERNFGIFRPDGTLSYDIGLMKTTAAAPSTGSPATNSSSNSTTTPASSPPAPASPAADPGPPNNPGIGPGGPGPVWCVAKPNADANSLLVALNYACGEGLADCTAIQFGAQCFYPNDLPSHASYAFNSYFVKHGGNKWNCYFGNTAMLTLSDPSYGVCTYPSVK